MGFQTQATVTVHPTLLQHDPCVYAHSKDGVIQHLGFQTATEIDALIIQEQQTDRSRLDEEWQGIEFERAAHLVQEKVEVRQRAEEEMQHLEKEQREEAEQKQREASEAQRLLAERAEAERIEKEARVEQRTAFNAAVNAWRQREAEASVRAFLQNNGYKGVTEKRSKFCCWSYPLHTAVAQNNADLVKALLKCGADPKHKNSAGQTPLALAQKYNEKGSHRAVLVALIAESALRD